jgi:hypothetical protein
VLRIVCVLDRRLSIIGKRYARVLPLPVSAARITSVPFSISGVARTCIKAYGIDGPYRCRFELQP